MYAVFFKASALTSENVSKILQNPNQVSAGPFSGYLVPTEGTSMV